MHLHNFGLSNYSVLTELCYVMSDISDIKNAHIHMDSPTLRRSCGSRKC